MMFDANDIIVSFLKTDIMTILRVMQNGGRLSESLAPLIVSSKNCLTVMLF
jgi:hypothetical protein